MRPASIVQFERLYLSAMAVGLISDVLAWSGRVAVLRADPQIGALAPTALAIGLGLAFAIMLALWYFAAHRRSVTAKWLVAGWFVVSTVMLALSLFRYGFSFSLAAACSWATYLLRAWSVSYLFKPDADAWFAKDASPR